MVWSLSDLYVGGSVTLLAAPLEIDHLSAAIIAGSNDVRWDLNRDGAVNHADRVFWVEELRSTSFGDANLDGSFNSSDLVHVFQAGQYEDTIPHNSIWGTGDWNGDGDFTTRDLVVAMQGGGYVAAANWHSVPEPCLSASALVMLLVALAHASRRH